MRMKQVNVIARVIVVAVIVVAVVAAESVINKF